MQAPGMMRTVSQEEAQRLIVPERKSLLKRRTDPAILDDEEAATC